MLDISPALSISPAAMAALPSSPAPPSSQPLADAPTPSAPTKPVPPQFIERILVNRWGQPHHLTSAAKDGGWLSR